MFEKIKNFVLKGLWTKTMVENVFKKDAITEAEYNELIALFKEA